MTVGDSLHVTAAQELIFASISAASGMVMIVSEEPLINEARVVPELSIQLDELEACNYAVF